jgi:hypothetical protein
MKLLPSIEHEYYLTLVDDMRTLISNMNNYGRNRGLPKDNQILVVQKKERFPGMIGQIITMDQYNSCKSKYKRTIKTSASSTPKQGIPPTPTKYVPLIPTINKFSSLIDEGTQTDHTESYLANEKVNKCLNVHRSIKENLDKLIEIQIKLNQSKKEVMEVIQNHKNKLEMMQEIKDKGFALSYAGVLKIGLGFTNQVTRHDFIHEHKSIIADAIKEQDVTKQAVKLQEILRLERDSMFRKDYDSEDEDREEYDSISDDEFYNDD